MDLAEALNLALNATSPFAIENFINGRFVPTERVIDSVDPSTGQVWAHVPDSDAVQVNQAVEAADKAFKSWSQTSVQYRSTILNKIADIVEANLSAFAAIESKDQGKPVNLAKVIDVPRCVHNFRFFATAILHDTNESVMQQEPVTALNYVVKQPIGVAGLISPWNLPLYLLSFKIAPALAAGNTVVAKPSEFTSVTAWLLAYVFQEAGVPEGVVNIVFGNGPRAGEPLVLHPRVPIVSFTGSTLIGRRIAEITAPLNKKLSLEMGGKNPCIVFESADVDKAMPTIIKSCFSNQGEICLCTSRLFVHKNIFDEFAKKFSLAANALKVGAPQDDVDLGAVVSEQHYRKITSYIGIARDIGATFLCGERSLHLSNGNKSGFFVQPTAVTNISDDSRLMQEEIFGPVICVLPFETEDEVITRANNVIYGLSASVWSNDVSQVHRVAQKLQAGTVWCNCWLVRELNMPFGGTKASGVGRESAKDSIEFFTEKKTVIDGHMQMVRCEIVTTTTTSTTTRGGATISAVHRCAIERRPAVGSCPSAQPAV
uniref:Aldehyde dehydrogenase domain-containing protein n=1 Tax=Plectus sambesii TaxID=2011161 RepID=A0A914WLT9_9BILA